MKTQFYASLVCLSAGLLFTAVCLIIVAQATERNEINFALFVGAHALLLSGAGLVSLVSDIKCLQRHS